MKKVGFMIFITFLLFTGCNDKYIYHECQHSNDTGIRIDYDWSETEEHKETSCELIVIGEDGKVVEIETGHDGSTLELPSGKYAIFVYEKTEMIQKDRHKISVHKKENGCLYEPIPFSAGEGVLTVENGKMNVGVVKMIRQTRELIVQVRIRAKCAHLMPYNSFDGELTGITLTRDIYFGFIPQTCSHREMAAPEYGLIDISFERNEEVESNSYPIIFTARHCLIGVGGLEIPNILSLQTRATTTKSSSYSFLTFDATNPLIDFHTLENPADPYVLILDLDLEDTSITGEIRGIIVDWKLGKETDLIANEK